jgi:catechol 2,3-dioxygenase-like lactoylglutathione lyase family enzyme
MQMIGDLEDGLGSLFPVAGQYLVSLTKYVDLGNWRVTMVGSSDVVLSRIGVLMLGVTDMGRSLAFYRDKLGLSVRGAAGEFAFLDAGGVMLALRRSAELGSPPAEEWVEVVFSVEDIASAFGALRARGVEFRREPRLVTDGQHAADFRDPDGHVLSIFGPLSAP